ARAHDRRVHRRAELAGRCRGAANRDAPRLAGGEELVRVYLVPPAEEVRRGVVFGRAVHGEVEALHGMVVLLERGLLREALRLLRCWTFHVTARHETSLARGAAAVQAPAGGQSSSWPV